MEIGLGIGLDKTGSKLGETIDAKALILRWDSISSAPVVDPSDVAQWNTFFDLPTNGTPFSSVTVNGNFVYLYGGAAISVKDSLFVNNLNILGFVDNSNVVTKFALNSFNGTVNNSNFRINSVAIIEEAAIVDNDVITELNLPAATSVGFSGIGDNNMLHTIYAPALQTVGEFGFTGNVSITTLYLPSIVTLGLAVTDDTVFNGISGNNITLTIPAALMTCNAGGPHASIALLQLNNDVTVIEI